MEMFICQHTLIVILYELETLYISLKHDGCWGSITYSSNVMIRTQFFKPFLKHSSMLGIISVKGDTLQDFSDFIEQFKKHKTIQRVVSTKRVANVMNLAFFESSKHMTASIMSDYPIFHFSNKIIDGIEFWNIILPRIVSNYLKQDLSDVAKILAWGSKYDDRDILSIYSQLTEIESLILGKAEQLGYFESPRKIDLEKLSNMIGVSKQAASVTLRRALRKLVGNNLPE